MNFKHVNPLPRDCSVEAATSKIFHRLLATASFEVLARDVVLRPTIFAQIEKGTEVYIPFPPNGSWEETLEACRLLLKIGCRPVPHLPARRVRDREELINWSKSLEKANVRHVMLIAGDISDQDVYFKDSLDVLQTKILATHGIRRVGVTVYPDGHPFIATHALESALHRKSDIASRDGFTLHAVSQFGFDASPLVNWLAKSNDSGLHVPLSVGVAGPTQMKTLIRFAAKCGVKHSVKGLFAKPSVLRVLGQWDPLQVLLPVAERLASAPDIQVENAHVFTFGGLRRVLEWREQQLKMCETTLSSSLHE